MKPENKKISLFPAHLILLAALALLMTVSAGAVQDGGEIMIQVKNTVIVKGPRILLGEIALVNAPEMIRESLEKADMGPSPKPGKIKSINKSRIASTVKGLGLLPGNVKIECPKRAYVKRDSHELSREEVKKFVQNLVEDYFSPRESRLIRFDVKGLEPYPSGNLRLVPSGAEIVDKKGKLSFFINVLVEDLKVDRLSISGSAEVFGNVLCAGRTFARSETPSQRDLVLKKKNVFSLDEDYVRSFDEIKGKIFKKNIQGGAHLNKSYFISPPLVKKGDVITLVARNNNLTILTSGISREDGLKDQVIRVENITSGRMVRGVVKEKSKVEVIY